MRRHAWFTIFALAQFLIAGPLCALVCLEDFQTVARDVDSEMPCHEESPAEPSESEQDCDCDTVAAPAALAFKVSGPIGAFLLRAPILRAAPSPSVQNPLYRLAVQVPPPDILLLKSTLIL